MPGRLAWLIALSLILGACQSPVVPSLSPAASLPPSTLPSTISPSPTPVLRTAVPATRTRISTSEGNYRIELALFDSNGRTAVASDIGSTLPLTIAFRPSKDITTQWSDGSSSLYSEGWSLDSGVEMRYCKSVGRRCTPPDQWTPFQSEQHTSLTVDWVGLSNFQVVAQFRDASGKIIPAGLTLSETASSSIPIEGIVNDRTPVSVQPPAIQTTIAQARAAFPVVGQVEVGQGSAMGGKAGTTIDIPVRFQASSPVAAVKEMRVKASPIGRCLTTDEMGDAPWEPMALSKTYAYRVPLNWSTFKLHVQYRDAQGNLSPIYCGEIAVEGQP
jgi:hypothetical protein